MLSLVKNDFIENGTCKYEDETGNRAFMKRNEKGFVAKLKFANPMIKLDAVNVTVPIPKDEAGVNVNIHYLDGNKAHYTKEVQDVISDFGELINYWNLMLIAVQNLNCSNDIIAKVIGYTGEDYEEVASRYKLEQLCRYEELHGLVKSIFGEE